MRRTTHGETCACEPRPLGSRKRGGKRWANGDTALMTDHSLPPAGWRLRIAAFLRGSIEAVVLTLVCVSPWVLGAVEPGAEFCLFCGVSVALVLWAARMLVEGALTWEHSPVALGLAG